MLLCSLVFIAKSASSQTIDHKEDHLRLPDTSIVQKTNILAIKLEEEKHHLVFL